MGKINADGVSPSSNSNILIRHTGQNESEVLYTNTSLLNPFSCVPLPPPDSNPLLSKPALWRLLPSRQHYRVTL